MRDAGKLFHIRAAATGKARSPTVELLVGGMTSVDVDDERRCRRAARSDTRCDSREKYDGARQRMTSTESLNSIRCSILRQYSSWRSGVAWSYLYSTRNKSCSSVKYGLQSVELGSWDMFWGHEAIRTRHRCTDQPSLASGSRTDHLQGGHADISCSAWYGAALHDVSVYSHC